MTILALFSAFSNQGTIKISAAKQKTASIEETIF